MTASSLRYCVSLLELVSPLPFSPNEKPEKIYKFYDIFINPMYRIVRQHEGKIVKQIGDSIKSYFPKTNNSNDNDANKEALECCLKQIESRNSISKKMNHEGFPEIYYKITADYEIDPLNQNRGKDWYWNTIPSVSLINKISMRTPSDAITVGEDLFKAIISFQPFQQQYNLDTLGKIQDDSSNDDSYSFYLLTRKRAVKVHRP